jgi:hypothetical protein
MLSLPIPVGQKDIRISVKYYPRSLLDRPKEFLFQVSEYATLNEIRTKIVEELPKEQTAEVPFITRIKNKCVSDILKNETFVKNLLEKSDEIVAYERIALPDNPGDNYFLLEIRMC